MIRAPFPNGALRPTAACLLAASVALLSACAASTGQRVYDQESFDTRASAFSREFVASPSDTCGAARRALLSQGYVVQLAPGDQMQAHKRFQPAGEIHVQIDFHVVCAPTARGQPTTVAFVSAVQDRYTLKKTPISASVGVSPLGSISLPFATTSDALVKVASETIGAGRFYDRFFDLVEHHLAEQMALNVEGTVTAASPAAPADTTPAAASGSPVPAPVASPASAAPAAVASPAATVAPPAGQALVGVAVKQ
jgi:hypothetical protein